MSVWKYLIGDDVSQVIVAVTLLLVTLILATVGMAYMTKDVTLIKEMLAPLGVGVAGLLALARGRPTNGTATEKKEEVKKDETATA